MKRSQYLYNLLILLLSAVAFLVVVSLNTSPLSPSDTGDSSIYRLLGLGILNGRLPYVDLFDNKGAYLYLIEALGQLLWSGRLGIFLLQTISLTATLWFIYHLATLFLNQRNSLFAVGLSLLLLGGCYQGGNHVEEYMLPFLSLSMLLAIRLFLHTEAEWKPAPVGLYSTIWGVCFGIVLLMRPNDAVAFFGGIMIGVEVCLLRQRQRRTGLQAAALFVVGAVMAVLPIVVWFGSHHALNAMFYAIYGANSQRAGGLTMQAATLLMWGKWSILLLMILLCVLIVNTPHRRLLWLVIPTCALQIFFVGENLYAHYFIPLFPLLALLVVMLFQQRQPSIIILSVAVLCLSHRPLPRMAALNYASCVSQIVHNWRHPASPQPCPIPDAERSSVWNHSADPWREGSPMTWLIDNGIVQINRCTVSRDAYIDEIAFDEVNPQWVVSYGDEFVRDPLYANYALQYTLADSVVNSHYTLFLYRRTTPNP